MNLYCLTKYLPEDVVRHILSFDDRIVVRRGNIHIIHKLNKELYKESHRLLLKRPLIKEGRTTVYNGKKSTWCTISLRNYLKPSLNPYISYSSNEEKFEFSFDMWAKGGKYRKTTFVMP
jgi:hypothetical protein